MAGLVLSGCTFYHMLTVKLTTERHHTVHNAVTCLLREPAQKQIWTKMAWSVKPDLPLCSLIHSYPELPGHQGQDNYKYLAS